MGRKAKAQTIGYKYSLGMVMTICHAPIDFVTELIFGEKSAWQGQTKDRRLYINEHELFGGDKKEGGVAGSVNIHSGKPNQQVDPYIEHFRGETSAQRGLLTMVFGDEGYVPDSDYRTIDWDKSTISEKMYQGISKSISEHLKRIRGDGNYVPDAFARINNSLQALKIIAGKENGELTDALLLDYLKEISAGNRTGYAFEDTGKDGRNWNRPERRLGAIPQLREKYKTNRGVAMAYTKAIFIDSVAGLYEHGSWRENGEHTIRFPADEFFGQEVRVKLKTLPEYTRPFYWGNSPYFKSTWVRVQAINSGWTHGLWYPEKAAIDGGVVEYTKGGKKLTFPVLDMNPAHILYKTLTNGDWGMGYHPSDIDEASFRKAADKLYDEKFGMSIIWDSAKTIEDFNAEILDTIDGVIRVNVITGRFELLLIRNDYAVSELPVLDESSIVEISRFERSSWGDGANEIVLTYKDRNESDVVLVKQNLAAIEIQRGVISSPQTYKGVHTKHIAELIAERELKLTSSSIAKMSIKINRLNYLLQNGDVFVLQWKNLGIKSMVCRVGSIVRGEFDDGIIEVEAVEDIFGITKSSYEVIPDDTSPEDGLNRVVLTAEPIKTMRVMEASYHDLQTVTPAENLNSVIRLVDGGSTYPLILAEKPSLATMNYDLFASNGGSALKKVADDVSFNPTFRLAQDVEPTFETFRVDDFNSQPPVVTEDMYIVVNDECMSIDAIEDDGTIRVKRGILDTLPAFHVYGDIGYIVTVSNVSDPNNYAVGSTLSYKTVAQSVSNSTSPDDSKEVTTDLIGRAARPAPVNSVTINENYFPVQVSRSKPIVVSWNTRNRKQMIPQNVYWGSGSVTPEEGQTTSIKLFNPNIEGDEGLIQEVKNTEETSHTFIAPKREVELKLGNSVPDLVYHYDLSKKPLVPRVGSNTQPAVVHGTGEVDGAVKGTKVPELGVDHWIDLPYDNALNSNTFTAIARLKFGSNNIPIFTIGEVESTTKTLGYQRFAFAVYDGKLVFWVGDESPVYFSKEFDISSHIDDKFHDVAVAVDMVEYRVEMFVDGESVAVAENPVKFPYNPAGVENLFSIADAIHNTIDETDTIYGVQSSQLVSDFIEVLPSTAYALKSEINANHEDGYLFYAIYDADKTLIDEVVAVEDGSSNSEGLIERSTIFTTPENAKYIKVGSSYLQNGNGRLMFAKLENMPDYNLKAGDKWLYELPATGKAHLGVHHHLGSAEYADSDTVINDFLLYGKVLEAAEIKAISEAFIQRHWPEVVGIEIETERNNLTSWQKFRWIVETALFD